MALYGKKKKSMYRIPKQFEVNGSTYECNVDSIHLPTIERIFRGTTESDERIQALSIPNRPLWLWAIVKVLRWYRCKISPRLGNRCVFEPSCSHYAELAFRKNGLFKGFWLSVNRLYRCRPGAGGLDLP